MYAPQFAGCETQTVAGGPRMVAWARTQGWRASPSADARDLADALGEPLEGGLDLRVIDLGGGDDEVVLLDVLDVEADTAFDESAEGVGTRHRSAYRLCKALPDVIAVVISQDGNVRFIKRKDGAVTYWDQA